MRTRRLCLVALLATASLTLIPSSATGGPASCLTEPKPKLARAIEESRDVFVGTVYSTSFDGFVAMFEVHEVWKGYIYTDFVEVKGVSQGGFTNMKGEVRELARRWEEGKTYLVLPSDRVFRQFRDNSCTRTQIYTPRLDRFRPASAATPMPKPPPSPRPDHTSSPSLVPGDDRASFSFPIVPVGIVVLFLGASVIWLKTRKG